MVTGIHKFVVSDLAPCVNLKKLDIRKFHTGAATNALTATLPHRPIQLNQFISGTGNATGIMNICTAHRPDGQPVIDFGSLAKITVKIEKDNDVEASEELIRREQFTNVSISCKRYLSRRY